MLLQSKPTKYKKSFKHKLKGMTSKGHKIAFGHFALKSLEKTRLTAAQIESARKVMVKKMKRLGFLWIRVFPNIPVTKKPNENRMGKGKGSVHFWVARIQEGQILYEMSGFPKEIAKIIFQSGAKKLPISTKFIEK